MSNIKTGDWVVVLDQGLIAMQRFAPKNALPNNVGRVRSQEDGMYFIEFPIGKDKISEHSQLVPYPMHLCHKTIKPKGVRQ